MIIQQNTFLDFITDFEDTLKHLFHEAADIDLLSQERGLPAHIRQAIMAQSPLSVAIPEAYGGRGCSVKECLGLLAAASYESLPLSLTFGINIALFLEPLAKYGDCRLKEDILSHFVAKQHMGGLMITEPNYGSDALNMRTYNMETENGYSIHGTKHWQGLTGLADHWIVASRKKSPNGDLARDIDFFVCQSGVENQQIEVEAYYDSLGLYMIPYGLNKIEVSVPKEAKLATSSTGIRMMLDILHRSRLQFPGMGMGFIKRMLDEAISQCTNRVVGATNLLSMDQVQYQIAKIQSAYTVCSAMCAHSSHMSSIAHDLDAHGIEANSMKAVVTDIMQDAAQTVLQLSGAKGYRISHIAGRGTTDSRPFQIFEGSNEMLYSQITDMVSRLMKKQKQFNLSDFLKDFDLTAKAAAYFKDEFNFQLSSILPQRKQVDLGKILGRVVSLNYVEELYEKGFRKDLVENCIQMVKHEIAGLMSTFHNENNTRPVVEYTEGSSWLQFS